MDSATEDVRLDPHNQLVDTPCMPGDLINTSCQPSRCNSVGAGTLTSWQLLAQQVGSGTEEEELPTPCKKAPAAALVDELTCSPRSASWTSGLHRITPRPHHALYKEYRILETIVSILIKNGRERAGSLKLLEKSKPCCRVTTTRP
jgi:hypothetical protein